MSPRTSIRLLSLALLFSAASGLLAATPDASWPQFHGARRDNVSTETGLLKQWPEGGPRLLWKQPECGRGYAGVALAGGTLYTSGDFDQVERVIALDLDGKILWKTENGKAWRGAMPGSRTTPTFVDGTLYHMNPTGRLAALDATTGKELWAVDLKADYGADWGTWAMSENILIDGGTLYCAPGGPRGRIVALDGTTGKPLWASTDVPDRAAYCSPLLVTVGDTRQLITILQRIIVSVDAATGKLLWTHRHETKEDQNVTTPIYHDGRLFASSGHGTGGRLLKFAPDGKSVTEVWLNKDLDNCHGGILLLGDRFVGSGCRLFGKGFVCVDAQTGKTLWNEKKLGKLSFTWADGLLYGLDDRRKVSLVDAGRDACRIVSQFELPKESRELTLCHPVVAGGRLYLRNWNTLYAYDVAK